jgi:hypothetical protein
LNGDPAVTDAGTEERTKEAAEDAETKMAEEVTETDPSDAPRVWDPADLSWIAKDPVPPTSVAGDGTEAFESDEVMEMDPG